MLRAYDDEDRPIKEEYLDVHRQLTAGPNGPATVTWQYDGPVKVAHFYDTARKEIPQDGCMTSRSILDQRIGAETEFACLDAQGNMINGTRTKFNAHGLETEKAWYREDWRLASSPQYAIRRRQYDDHGNMTEEAYFGEDEKLRLGAEGYAIIHGRYNDRDQQTDIWYFDENKKPRLAPKIGCAAIRHKYNDRGNPIEEACLGEDEKLHVGPEGYAKASFEYIDGKATAVSFLDETEKLRVSKFGCANARIKYDNRGNLLEKACFGEDGKLRLWPEGYAMFRDQYDDHNRRIEEAYFGGDEKPVVAPNLGYAIRRNKYDERGELIETRYFGADGALTDSSGPAVVEKRAEIVARDKKNELLARCQNDEIDGFFKLPRECSDGAGRPLVSHPAILDVPPRVPESPAQELGLRAGDIIEAYDGKQVFTPTDLSKLTGLSGEGGRRIDVVREGRPLVFEAPAGRLGILLGFGFVAADSSPSAEQAGK